jgi:AraC family transcriptional regulator, regulatory protein of adaptative response / DNA-3-methyladenine glycosylase II
VRGLGYGAPVMTSTHRLRAVGRHDTARVLAFLGAHAVPGVEAWDGARWTTSLRLPGGPAVAQVERAPAGAGAALVQVRLHLTDPADETLAIERLRHALDLDSDVADAERILGADEVIGALVRSRPGLRVPGTTDPWETLVRTVIGQQVSVVGARTVTAVLVQAAGRPLPAALRSIAPGLTHLFPDPHAVAALPVDTPALRMPRSRASAVLAAADAFCGTELPSRTALLALPGIGPWTVDYLDVRARRDPDVLLATDLAVRRAVERLGHDGSPRALRELGRRWAPHRSLAMLHLWAEYLSL